MPLRCDDDPIDDDEWFYRFVFKHNLKKIVKIRQSLKPRDNEEKGISIFRCSCLASPKDCLRALRSESRPNHGVFRFPMTLLVENGLTVVSNKTDVPGHCLIPEIFTGMNWNDPNIEKATWALAKFGIENIVLNPAE